MNRYRNLLHLSLAAGLLLAATAARADTLTLTLDAPTVSGGVYTFDGTIAYTGSDAINDGSVTEYLNGDNLTVNLPATSDDSAFNNNAPLSMNPGDSYTGELFTVNAPYIDGGSNLYTGSFQIVGGPDPNEGDADGQELLATGNFAIQVTPEPGSLLLLLSGLTGIAAASKLRKA